jgi:hypothetical protein
MIVEQETQVLEPDVGGLPEPSKRHLTPQQFTALHEDLLQMRHKEEHDCNQGTSFRLPWGKGHEA